MVLQTKAQAHGIFSYYILIESIASYAKFITLKCTSTAVLSVCNDNLMFYVTITHIDMFLNVLYLMVVLYFG